MKPYAACHVLRLDSILSAHIHKLNEEVFKKSSGNDGKEAEMLTKSRKQEEIFDVMLKIVTKPGNAE